VFARQEDFFCDRQAINLLKLTQAIIYTLIPGRKFHDLIIRRICDFEMRAGAPHPHASQNRSLTEISCIFILFPVKCENNFPEANIHLYP